MCISNLGTYLVLVSCTAVKGQLETIKVEGEDNDPVPEEEAAVAAPRFVPMTEGLEGYFSNMPVLAAFQDAIIREPGLFRDAVVLDLTAALGLFSLWAVRRAGARRAIVVVDHPGDAVHAREFARRNKMASRVTVVVGPIQEIELPEEKVSSRPVRSEKESLWFMFIFSSWAGNRLIFTIQNG